MQPRCCASDDGGLRHRVGGLLLVAFAEVPPDNAALRRPRRSRLCAIRTCRLAPETRRASRSPSGQAGELDRAVDRLLLVTVAEARLADAALRRHRLREVCDSYMRMPSETTQPSVGFPQRTRGERPATFNAGIWILVSMQQLPAGKTSFCPAAILGANTAPCSSRRTSYGTRRLRGIRRGWPNTSIACLPADRRVGMTACSSGAGPWR